MGSEGVFQDVYALVLFCAALWVVGKISARLGLPSLVGEIVTGIILGPNLLDFVPKYDALKIIGDIGLLLLVLEAGIDVKMGVLKVVGIRGLMIAIFGSMFPLAIGAFLAYVINPSIELAEAISIGACFGPTSMGIALNVLRNHKVLDTPTGQLIIAAAILDDVIALMLLSVLQELSADHPSIVGIMIPIVTSPLLILVFGFIAVKVSPPIIKAIMDKIALKDHEMAILLMLFSSMLVLVPCCYYAKSSYLLGGFLCGLMFCTDHTIHHVWEKQMQKIMHWMLRIFFACTIGFEVPIKDFANPKIIKNSMIYFTAILGKVATGFFGTSKPMNKIEFCTIAFSMSAWGEFAFILATSAYNHGIFGKDTLSEVLAAVLLSVIVSPLLLRMTLVRGQKAKDAMLEGTRKHKPSLDESALESDLAGDAEWGAHFVYYRIHTKTFGKWGHQDRLLRGLYSLNLEIIDFRAFNEPKEALSGYTPYVENVFYVKDTELSLLPTRQLSLMSQKKLTNRVHVIKYAIKDALQDRSAKIEIMRWLPGIKKTDDVGGLPPAKFVHRVSVSYVRDEAYKEARMSLSYAQLPKVGWGAGHDDDDAVSRIASAISAQSAMLPNIRRQPKHYLSRIRSESHHDFDVVDNKTDELVRLIDYSMMDLRNVNDDGSSLSTDLEVMNLADLRNSLNLDQHLRENGDQTKPKVRPFDHKTPLLKRKKKP